jgi:hypothetical protein
MRSQLDDQRAPGGMRSNKGRPRGRGRGAYGLTLKGLPNDDLLVPITPGQRWPVIQVRQRLSDDDRGPDSVGEAQATLALVDGEYALIKRRQRSATFLARSSRDDGRLVHPFLTAIGAIFALWHGHEALHGGAFVHDGGAWGLIGEREAGKSSMLAALATAGEPILTDDLLVVAGDRAFAGPRCVDLRPSAPAALALDGRTEPVRGGERRRLRLGPVEPELPLRGLIFLAWGRDLELRPLAPSERLERLSPERCIPGTDPTRLLDLLRLPAWLLQRPHGWSSLEPAVELLRLAVR